MTKAEMEVMQQQAKEQLGLPANPQKLGRGPEGFCTGVKGSTALLTPCFGFLASRTVRQHISIILSHPVCAIRLVQLLLHQPNTLFWQLQETNRGTLLLFFYYVSVVIRKLVTCCQNSNMAFGPSMRQLSQLNVSQGSFGTPVLKNFWMALKHCIQLLSKLRC